ncbi:MAG: glycine cleavage system aminomethyltransferase T, partial [Parasphingorhabdus sp.]
PIYYGDRIVGHTTSAAFGYRIGKPIALAHVHIDNPDGMNVELDITGVRFKARMQYAPAFDPAGSRMKTEN